MEQFPHPEQADFEPDNIPIFKVMERMAATKSPKRYAQEMRDLATGHGYSPDALAQQYKSWKQAQINDNDRASLPKK